MPPLSERLSYARVCRCIPSLLFRLLHEELDDGDGGRDGQSDDEDDYHAGQVVEVQLGDAALGVGVAGAGSAARPEQPPLLLQLVQTAVLKEVQDGEVDALL